MSEVRLIDANALEKMAIPCEIHNGASTELCVPLYQIRNAPTLPNPCGNPCNFAKPTGNWIKCDFHDFGACIYWNYKCTNCEAVYSGQYNYCPNCGAKMKQEAENERT